MQLTGARPKVRKSLRSPNNQISDSGTLWMTTGLQFGFGRDWVDSAVRPLHISGDEEVVEFKYLLLWGLERIVYGIKISWCGISLPLSKGGIRETEVQLCKIDN
ncbi:hypothetical protein HNY73_012911 [Argiope bruennichi]|uniref:Uncharacterized protein n=1 Tax=Argiope bruennichi TaxID=94029 RepID=A0A8T0F0Y0_ARGBR|nr:hypothetical protein HNY73_012911 [Argiope bruennichi]